MTRKKVNLAYITSDSKRRGTFKKRKNGLIKKVDEISTLCGIEACAVIFSQNDPEPEVWPSPWGVQRVLSRFQRLPELEQSKKMLNQESFLKQRIQKAQEQLKKQRNDNKSKEMTQLMFQCLNAGQIFDNVTMNDLNDLSWLIDQNLKQIERNIEGIQTGEVVQNVGETLNVGEQAHIQHAQGLENNVDAMQRQQWPMDFPSNNIGDQVLSFEDVNNVPNGVLWP
ncbi:agamous-like MADS-box protein AGL80 [Cicer arietinum]|uniref:Agamous-like MADS-box protein AGL80 n=1 Tax=Cicer arietinum TaxID=3827 RepID=A0A1S2Y723_CICAR|nr:agamous-like MADS-box protein AGL80 [Cicer arietinum]